MKKIIKGFKDFLFEIAVSIAVILCMSIAIIILVMCHWLTIVLIGVLCVWSVIHNMNQGGK